MKQAGQRPFIDRVGSAVKELLPMAMIGTCITAGPRFNYLKKARLS